MKNKNKQTDTYQFRMLHGRNTKGYYYKQNKKVKQNTAKQVAKYGCASPWILVNFTRVPRIENPLHEGAQKIV